MFNRWGPAWGVFLLRFSLGMLFFTAGLNKFIGGLAGARQGIAGMFAKTWLPPWSVSLFAGVLPYFEVLFGALLVVGLFRIAVLPLASLLMLSLTFGMLVAGQNAVVAYNMIYVFMFAAAAASRWDLIALDRLIFRVRRD
jgi:uncharacterized membrane protein YphA (DoxX/SURF4 family)